MKYVKEFTQETNTIYVSNVERAFILSIILKSMNELHVGEKPCVWKHCGKAAIPFPFTDTEELMLENNPE